MQNQSNKFLYLYLAAAFTVIGLGIFLSLQFGSQPRTLPEITLNYFTDEKELAESIQNRLDVELGQASVYILGVEPHRPEHIKLWLEYIKLAQVQPNKMVHHFLIENDLFNSLNEELKAHFNEFQKFDLKSQANELFGGLQSIVKQGQKALIITPNVYSFKILDSSPFKLVQDPVLKAGMINISAAFLPVQPEDLSQMMFPCKSQESDRDGTAHLGCIIQNKAASVRRKVKANQKMVGLMDLIGENDHLVLMKSR